MKKQTLLTCATTSLIALSLQGCATQKTASNTVDQSLNSTQSVLNTTQSTLQNTQKAVDTAQSIKNAGLAGVLTQQLGVNSTQATAGAGALLQVAQAKMSTGDFQQLAQSVPEVNGLINSVAAPKTNGLSQIAAGTSVLLGDKNNTLGSAVNIVNTFQQLGLSSDMVGQFIPVISNYVSQNATPYLTNALISSLSGL